MAQGGAASPRRRGKQATVEGAADFLVAEDAGEAGGCNFQLPSVAAAGRVPAGAAAAQKENYNLPDAPAEATKLMNCPGMRTLRRVLD